MGVIYAMSFSIIAFVTAGLIALRNAWVYRTRTRLLQSSIWTGFSHYPYDRLPSYDAMMWRFWVWDVNKFLEDQS